jgi:hypothetical protein
MVQGMGMQDIFYLVGIIYMVLIFIVLVGTIVGLFIIKNKVTALQRNVKGKINLLKHFRVNKYHIAEDSGMLAAVIGRRTGRSKTKLKR